jgi:hypothetical protein
VYNNNVKLLRFIPNREMHFCPSHNERWLKRLENSNNIGILFLEKHEKYMFKSHPVKSIPNFNDFSIGKL